MNVLLPKHAFSSSPSPNHDQSSVLTQWTLSSTPVVFKPLTAQSRQDMSLSVVGQKTQEALWPRFPCIHPCTWIPAHTPRQQDPIIVQRLRM